MLHAWRGVGKTFFALSAAQAIASESKFLKWRPQREWKVIYIDGEMGFRSLRERIIKIDSNASFSAKIDLLNILSFEDTGGVIWNLADYSQQQKYTNAIEDWDVVFIDNIASCVRTTGRETEREAWMKVQEWAIKMRLAGKTIFFIHHSGKMGTQRGISDREDVMDTVICLKRSENYEPSEGCSFELHFEKARNFYGDDARALKINLTPSGDSGLQWEWDHLSTLEEIKAAKAKRKSEARKNVNSDGGDDDEN